MTEKKLRAVVLAAGKGTRLNSESEQLPKVMRLAAGRPLLSYVLEALPVEEKADVAVVVGYMKEKVTAAFDGYVFAEQKEQRGTGHAVMSAREFIAAADGDILVTAGDMPLVSRATYDALTAQHRADGNDCTVLAGRLDDGGSYGRIVRAADGSFLRITEAKDCTPEERGIREVNAGVYVFDAKKLLEAAAEITTANAQGEYYLTDVPDIMLRRGWKVGVYARDMGGEIHGVNTVEDLQLVEKLIKG